MTPGDKVEFNVNISNSSNVKVLYRLIVSCEEDNGLFSGLSVKAENSTSNTFDFIQNVPGITVVSKYVLIEPSDTTSKTLKMTVELPTTAGNEYQDKNCKIVCEVEAIQGNAKVEEDSTQLKLYNATDFVTYNELANSTDEDTKALMSSFSSLELMEDVDLTSDVNFSIPLELNNSVTIDGNGKTLSIPNGASQRVININDTTEDLTITLKNVIIDGPTEGYQNRGISIYGNTGTVKLVLDNCKFTCSYYPLAIQSYNENIEVVVKNTTLVGYCGVQTYSENSKLSFENCTLIGNNIYEKNSDNDFAVINVKEGAASSVLNFKNCNIVSTSTQGNYEYFLDIGAGCSVDFEGCTFKKGTQAVTSADDDLLTVVTGDDIVNNMCLSCGDTYTLKIDGVEKTIS